jgi:hypothetical protein
MLRDLRSGSGVRAAVCLAALLSLAGSAGLHPEPSGVGVRDAGLAGTLDAGVGGLREAPHVCQVCILYFACSLTPTGPVVTGVQPALPAVLRSRTPFGGGPDVRRHEGRAPPLAS